MQKHEGLTLLSDYQRAHRITVLMQQPHWGKEISWTQLNGSLV